MSRAIDRLLRAVLTAWEGPLPRLHYVTDAGNHPLEYYRRVLRPMLSRANGQAAIVDMVRGLLPCGGTDRDDEAGGGDLRCREEASAWAAKMPRF